MKNRFNIQEQAKDAAFAGPSLLCLLGLHRWGFWEIPEPLAGRLKRDRWEVLRSQQCSRNGCEHTRVRIAVPKKEEL